MKSLTRWWRPNTTPSAVPSPKHIAFIMDGNGRWAGKRGLPRIAGHKVGVDNIPSMLKYLSSKGVEFVTIFAFSTENWHRSEQEVHGLMQILQDALDHQTPNLHANNVRIIHIGTEKHLSDKIRKSVNDAQELTKHNSGITLNVAFDYGGRDEILEAVRRIISAGVFPEDLDESLFKSYLYTSQSPDPDLIIRTGGEIRLSNFLLWQSAYSEYYHTRTMWPDFGPKNVDKALKAFSKRQRRFGHAPDED
jgi:undecaprenyl diphosphate synthase